MTAIEKLLEQMSLQAPSDQLDARVMQSLASKQRPAARWLATLIASAACLVLGVAIGRAWNLPERNTQQPESQAQKKNPGEEAAQVAMTSEEQDDSQKTSATETALSDGNFLLLNGVYPARRYRAITHERVRLYNGQTGQAHETMIPIARDVLSQSHGI